MMSFFWRHILCGGLWLATYGAASPAAAAGSSQALDSIVAAAVESARERAGQRGYDKVSVTVNPLDERLRLPRCGEPLETFAPQSSPVLGATSVGIRCSGPDPWTIYVRTMVSARQSIPVLARSLPRYSVITESDIELVDQPLQSGANGVIHDPDSIIGMELTRALDAGSTVRLNQLRPPKVIKRGQQVTLITGLNGLEVKVQGKALGDATEGERVNVTNLSSGRQIEGIANADGTVSVQ